MIMQARHGDREATGRLLEHYRGLTPLRQLGNLWLLAYADQPELVTYLVQLSFSDEWSTEGSLLESVDFAAGDTLNKMINAYPYRNFIVEADYRTEDAIVLMREWIRETIDDEILANAGLVVAPN